MKVLYANIIFFLAILYALISAALIRLTSSFWQSMDSLTTEYDLVSLVFVIWLSVTTVGLIMKKPWAYAHALSANAVIAAVPVLIFIIATIMLWGEIDHLQIIKGSVNDFIASAIGFVFWLLLYKSSKVRNAYNKSLNLTGADNAPPS